jgi:hypothetical protein
MLWGIHRITASKQHNSASYRTYLIPFFSVWSFTLWIKPHKPSMWLFVITIGLISLVFILASIPRRAPKNRQQTKVLVEQLQVERRLNSFFRTPFNFIYWAFLYCLIWSVLFRLLLLYKTEIPLFALSYLSLHPTVILLV